MTLPNYLLSALVAMLFCIPAMGQKTAKDCPDIKATAVVVNETQKEKDGEIKINITGGKAPYIIQWFSFEFSATGQHIKNLKSGYYSAVIVDADKCIKQFENIQVKKEN